MGRIGGNVADIHGAAGVMTDAGTAASQSGARARQLSSQMEAELNDVTTALANHFQQTADELRQQITNAKQRLAATDWQGTSQQNATAAEEHLHRRTDAVLDNALGGAEEFKSFVLARANDFVASVEGDFNAILGEIDAAYQDLARASEKFAENLEAADQTVRFGG